MGRVSSAGRIGHDVARKGGGGRKGGKKKGGTFDTTGEEGV